MIKWFIVWYLKRHNKGFEYKDYIVRIHNTSYFQRLVHYVETMDGVNCRHTIHPYFDFGKKSGTKT